VHEYSTERLLEKRRTTEFELREVHNGLVGSRPSPVSERNTETSPANPQADPWAEEPQHHIATLRLNFTEVLSLGSLNVVAKKRRL